MERGGMAWYCEIMIFWSTDEVVYGICLINYWQEYNWHYFRVLTDEKGEEDKVGMRVLNVRFYRCDWWNSFLSLDSLNSSMSAEWASSADTKYLDLKWRDCIRLTMSDSPHTLSPETAEHHWNSSRDCIINSEVCHWPFSILRLSIQYRSECSCARRVLSNGFLIPFGRMLSMFWLFRLSFALIKWRLRETCCLLCSDWEILSKCDQSSLVCLRNVVSIEYRAKKCATTVLKERGAWFGQAMIFWSTDELVLGIV